MIARNYFPAVKYGAKWLSSDVLSGMDVFAGNKECVFYVDADNGNDNNDGKTPDTATATIQQAVTLAAAANLIYKCGSTVYIKAKYVAGGATDPTNYAETIIIPAAGGANMRLIGVSNNRTQGGLPQIKKGSGTTALLTVRAPGCTIANLGFNGGGTTGGGILLDDDSTTKTAFGTTIMNCHFKNCKKHSTHGSAGGAINFAPYGGAFQVRIAGNIFYKNVCDINIPVGVDVLQDIVIEDNVFQSAGTSATDVNLYFGAACEAVTIRGNTFGALPALSSGDVGFYITTPTGFYGMISDNNFGSNGLTFDADDGTGGRVAATCFFVRNYQEQTGTGTAALILRDSA